jgi:hypothetical protein
MNTYEQTDERGDFQALRKVENAPKNKFHTMFNGFLYNGSIPFPTHVVRGSAVLKSTGLTPQHSPCAAANRSANPEC